MDAAEVRRLRAAAGLTQGKLAAKVGLSLRQIAYLEAGERRVEDDVAERIRTVCTEAAARKAMSSAA
ncbi:XRE family transcriptional regulator [Roseomonas genomospecies 6]|uniref:XRE family transcriptional regulator n=3 Tax=Pseudomonadota TaxID=1224 RepID=A0A9W7NIJ2_9PROT|nr:XRE family transcriptional regulator [Roseomonas genomospecies 6]KAA0686338.1 XRE family transcriptional regulator [Azospirillum brasilense]